MTSSQSSMFGKLKKSFKKVDNSRQNEDKQPQEEILPVSLTYLTPAMVEEAKEHLKETDEGREKALDEFRKLIDDEEILATPTDDMFLLAFLRSRKFNVKKAFKLLQNYWSFRKEYRNIYDRTDSQAVIKLIMSNFIGLLRHRDRNGSVVFIIRAGMWDPELNSYEDLFRAISGILVFAVQFPATQIVGFRAIVDIRGLSWKQLKYFTPANVLLLIRSTQFCFPARYKAIHLLSDNKMIHFFHAIVYPLLTAKLKKRISLHFDNFETIQEFIHPSILPEEFGGDAPQFNNHEWMDVLESHTHKLVGMLHYGYKN